MGEVSKEIDYNKDAMRYVRNLESMKNKQLRWFNKYWPEIKACEFPCNELQRARRKGNLALYREAECLKIQHEKTLNEAVIKGEKKLSFQELYEKDLRTKLKNVRQALGICDEDDLKNQESTCVNQYDRPCIRWRPGLIRESLDRLNRRHNRTKWLPSSDYSSYDSETSVVGFGCYDEPLEKCLGLKFFPKPNQMKFLYDPNGSFPPGPNALM